MDQYPLKAGEPVYEVVWPLGKTVADSKVDLAPALEDLNGKTVCEMWAGVYRGDEMYAILREELKRRYPRVKIVDHTLAGDIYHVVKNEREYATANLPRLMRESGADAIISSVGA